MTSHIAIRYAGLHDWSAIGVSLNGEGAVYGFFLLSGYSIAASLEREPRKFYARRVKRIWPTYICAVGIGIAVAWFCGPGYLVNTIDGRHMRIWPIEPVAIGGSLLMLQSFLTPVMGVIAPSWSLSIEWWLYMVAPLLKRVNAWVVGILIAASLLGFTAFKAPTVDPWWDLAWLWIAGFLYYRLRAQSWSPLIISFPMLAALQMGAHLFWPCIATATALIGCRHLPVLTRPFDKIFNWAGDLSYPLYLLHVPAITFLSALGNRNSLMMVVCSLAVSALILHGVDYPVRKGSLIISLRKTPVRTPTGPRTIPPHVQPTDRQTCAKSRVALQTERTEQSIHSSMCSPRRGS
ncbi:MAG: acyltransferase [Patescibacteria group bacterium]|nr:acyltransferase [Patescibacteria group bacterium]